MLELRTFGGLELRTEDGQRVDALAGRTKLLALLAYLAAEAPDGRVPRAELAPLLWPGGTDERARNALRVALTRIRQATESSLVAGAGATSLGLARDHVRADVAEFREALEAGEAARALEMYGGDFLVGIQVEGAAPFQRWADERRGEYRRQAYEAARSLGVSAREAGDLASAEERFRTALDLAPLREEAARMLIRTLADRGRTADAIRLYEAFRTRRREELDLATSDELAELVEELRGAHPPATSTTGSATSREDAQTDASTPSAGAPADAPSRRGARRATLPRDRSATRSLLGGLAVLGLLAAAIAGVWYLTGGEGDAPEVTEGTVAVLPFQVSGAGDDTWKDGMMTMLYTNLDGAADLRAIPDRTVVAAWEQSSRAGGGANTEAALAVAREVGAEYAVVGSAVELSGELRLVARIHATRSRDRVGRTEVRGPADSITSLTDSLTRRVLAVLLEGSDEGIPSVDLARLTTQSLPALKSFLAGERHLRAAEYEAAIGDFEAAVEADSTFALAYQRLGRANSWTGHGEAAIGNVTRAYRLADRLPERERRATEAWYLWRVEGRFQVAADSLRELTEQYPDDPVLWYNLGEVLWHGWVPDGWPEADGAFERAIELDPGHALYYPHHAQLGIAVRHDSALAAERIAGMPREDWRRAFRIPLDLAFGSPDTRQEALAGLDTISLSTLRRLGAWFSLWHPAERDAFATMLERLRRRQRVQEVFGEDAFRWRLVANSFLQGQVQEGLSRLEDWQPGPALKSCLLAYSISVGVSVPDTTVAAGVVPSSLESDPSRAPLRCAAIYLIERGREDEVDPLLAAIREGAGVEERDTLPPRVQKTIDEVEGYRAWKAGDLEEAARRLSGGTPADTWIPGTGGLWLGAIYREMGELETAEGWYLAAWTHPLAHERLGGLYEEMGEPEKAAAAYRRFIAAWEDADEELQPRVEAARERVRQLSGSEDEPDE